MDTAKIIELAKRYVKAAEEQAQEEATGYPVAGYLADMRAATLKAMIKEELGNPSDNTGLIKAIEAAKAVLALEEYLAE